MRHLIACCLLLVVAVGEPPVTTIPWPTFSAMAEDTTGPPVWGECSVGAKSVDVFMVTANKGPYVYLLGVAMNVTPMRWVLIQYGPDSTLHHAWFGIMGEQGDQFLPSLSLSPAEARERVPNPCTWLLGAA